jgi:hypothetical protein
MTTVVISQPMFFPWPGMLEHFALSDVLVHYDDVQFSKGSFVNRVQMKTETGSTWLTVPLAAHSLGTEIREIEIADRNWRDRHLELLKRAYHDAPHAETMLALVEHVYANATTALLSLLLDALDALDSQVHVLTDTRVLRSSDLGIGGSGSERVLEIVKHVGGDVYVTGHGAANYLDNAIFEAAGVEVRFMDYTMTPYPQLHGEFTPYVSALDLIANTGAGARDFLAPRTIAWDEMIARSS